jgi:putative tricarboxylic transport membrane protein
MKMTMTRRVVMAAAAATLAFGGSANAEAHQVLDQLHFLIPGGAGGGWDGTARGTGEALTEGRARRRPRPTRTCRAAAAARPSAI